MFHGLASSHGRRGAFKRCLGQSRWEKQMVSTWRHRLPSFRASSVGHRHMYTGNSSFSRRVEFPSTTSFPAAWIAFGIVLMHGVYERTMCLLEVEVTAKENIRQASTDAWGIGRTVAALEQIIASLAYVNGDAFWGWLNAAPTLIKNGVIEKAICPGLLSDHVEVAYRSAVLLMMLLQQQPVVHSLSADSQLLDDVMSCLKKWLHVNCKDCNNPAPALVFVIRSLAQLATVNDEANDKSRQILMSHVESLPMLINSISRKLRKAHSSARSDVLSRTITIFQGSIPPQADHSAFWYVPVVNDVAFLCESIATKFPEIAPKLIPSFNCLAQILGVDEFSEMVNRNSSILQEPNHPSLKLGSLILERVNQSGPPPEDLSMEEWIHFKRSMAFIDDFYSNRSVSTSRFLDSIETNYEPLMSTLTTGVMGFVWGAARTMFTLRSINDPSQINSNTTPQYNSNMGTNDYRFGRGHPNSPYSYPMNSNQNRWLHYMHQDRLPLQQNSFPQHNEPYPEFNRHHVSPNWKRTLIIRHAKLAAGGAMAFTVLHKFGEARGENLWVEDPKKQIALSGIKAVVDVSLVLAILRTAPYSLAPYIISQPYWLNTHTVVESISR